MPRTSADIDALVVGAGFYGTTIACYLAEQRGLRVLLVDRENSMLCRASFRNQARIHNGYHYPRSLTTAYRSRINQPRFLADFPNAIARDFTKIYAIARNNSRVTAGQFQRFCRDIGAPIARASANLRALFDPIYVEDVFEVEEYAFDADELRRHAETALESAGVARILGSTVTALQDDGARVTATLVDAGGRASDICARHVFVCTYAGLDRLRGRESIARMPLQHEITELALVRVPEPLASVGITVMDGPFFSCMPFPPRTLHTLSHVRYTPHTRWTSAIGDDPYETLERYAKVSRVDRMVRDACRYVPILRECVPMDSLFEVKTVLTKNESDDGRPILFEHQPSRPRCYTILGGKIDNIYDVIEKLDAETLGS